MPTRKGQKQNNTTDDASSEDTRSMHAVPDHEDKPKLKDGGIGSVLDTIYADDLQNGGKKEEEMDHLERKGPRFSRRARVLTVIFSLLFALTALAALGFVIFTNRAKFSGQNVHLEVSVPERVSSADTVTVTFSLQNDEQVSLADVTLAAEYPIGFTQEKSFPASLSDAKNAWHIGTLAPGEKIIVRVVGTLIGELGATKTFGARATYSPGNFSAEFDTSSSVTTVIASSLLELSLDGPKTLAKGHDQVAYAVHVKNVSSGPLARVAVRIIEPEGFQRTRVDPAEGVISGEWEIENLSSGGEAVVKLEGTLSGAVSSVRELTVKAGILGSDGSFLVQKQASLLTQIVEAGLALSLTLDGKDGVVVADRAVAPTLVVSYENTGDTELTDVKLTLAFAEQPVPFIDWALFMPRTGGEKAQGGVAWTKKERTELATLPPGAKGSFAMQLALKDVSNIAPLAKDYRLHISPSATFMSEGIGTAGGTSSGDELALQIATTLAVSSEARYFSDDLFPVGDGPLPPQVNLPTSYRIYWKLNTGPGDVRQFEVTATLPETVTWKSKNVVSEGTLSFDATSRTVTWTGALIKAWTGKASPELDASFSVSVTPTLSDIGTYLSLVGEVTARGNDAFTGKSLTARADALTTDLASDPGASGSGRVVATPPANVNTNTISNMNSVP